MFQAQSLHPNLTSHLSPSAHRVGISEIPSFPLVQCFLHHVASFCLLTRLSMQGYYMTFSSRSPHQVGNAMVTKPHGLYFSNNQSPQTALWTPGNTLQTCCRRVKREGKEGRRERQRREIEKPTLPMELAVLRSHFNVTLLNQPALSCEAKRLAPEIQCVQ